MSDSTIPQAAEPVLTRTPGEWVAINRSDPDGISKPWWEVVVWHRDPHHQWAEDVCMVFNSSGHAEGNAKLMAQAPAMLDALLKLANEAKSFVSMANPDTHGHTNIAVLLDRIELAYTAIAKAGQP